MMGTSAIDREFFPDDWWHNIYADPEDAGLEIVGVLDQALGYEFYTLIVFRDVETGGLYYAADSGGSFSVPFDDFQRLSDLTRIDPTHFGAFEQAVRAWNDDWAGAKVGSGEVARFLREVRAALPSADS